MTFNYNQIQPGFYDKIFDSSDGMRKFWHWHKFDSVLRVMDKKDYSMKVLDVGCFSGSFAGRFLNEDRFISTSIDILKTQIDYAVEKYQTQNRVFLHYQDFEDAKEILNGSKFDAVTFIEVIEHLDRNQILSFFKMIDSVTDSGAELIITTPNYLSAWPILEFILNRVSDVEYEEQHITKFTSLNIIKKLSNIYPELLAKYEVKFVTTSHFLSPYISLFNYKLAQKISAKYRGSDWKNPFGSIVILKLVKN